MSRVHGTVVIRRRNDYKKENNYIKYKDILVEDFHDICGYCGKNRKNFKDKFEIDHFRPKKKYPKYKNDYMNLVLSCSTCNNNKRDDWPTGNPDVSHNEIEGYVDPATDEFDKVFFRDENGFIQSNDEFGKYMISKLKLDKRLTNLIWKINILSEKRDMLMSKSELSNKDSIDLINIIKELDELINYLRYDMGE